MKSSTMLALMMGTAAVLPASAFAQKATSNPAMRDTSEARNTASPSMNSAMTVSAMQDQSVFTSSNREIGTIDSVVTDRSGKAFAVVGLDDSLNAGDRSVLIPLDSVSQSGGRLVAEGYRVSQIKKLPAFSSNANYSPASDNKRFNLAANDQAVNDGDRGRIVVRQAAPSVSLDQAAPRITVRQAQPDVTVNQAQPQIIVRQAPPTITVDQPQPEIIVRMPKPDVNVAMAQPQVSVNMPRPQIQVQQPNTQAQVQVERAQPQVRVEASNEQPNVNLQGVMQPNVQYERNGQPRVVYHQAAGQPTIRYEQMNAADGQNASADVSTSQANGAQRTASTQAAMNQTSPQQSAADRQALRDRLGVGDVENTAAISASAPTHAYSVSDIKDMRVYNARGEHLGSAERVILNPTTNREYLVLSSGGFLGIGADHVAFPLDRFSVRGDRLVIRSVTENDIDQMNDWKQQVSNYRTLNDRQNATLRMWQG